MDILPYFIKEYADCILWILKDPTAIDVEYNFYHMHELEEDLRKYVNEHNGQ